MKKQYESAEIELFLLNSSDIITTSTDIEDEEPIISGNGPIGGGGYDPNGWT